MARIDTLTKASLQCKLWRDEVMRKIRDTDTCTDLLGSPVEVWIDKDGFYRLMYMTDSSLFPS